jgi:adenosine deaminase
MKVSIEHFASPIKDFLFLFKTQGNAALFLELGLIGTLLILIAILLKIFSSKNVKTEQPFATSPQEEEKPEEEKPLINNVTIKNKKPEKKLISLKEEKPEIKVETEKKVVIKEISRSPKELKKYIDLHLHLDGAITLEIAKELAKLHNMAFKAKNDRELEDLLSVPHTCKSLNDFLNCFELPLSLMQTPEGLSESVRLVANNIQSHGVIYAEFRFAPQLHTDLGMTQEDAIKAALDGIKRTSLKVNLILCFMRGEGNEAQNLETLELARKYLVKDGGVVALDIAGAEALFKTKDYGHLFKKAREYGIPYTIHAGEADGPDSVKKAIEFGAHRIGHGVRSFEDDELVELINKKGIPLEMCPTSNSITIAIPDMNKFPFVDFLEKGLKVTLNTDDMGIERTNIVEEFNYLETKFNLTYDQKKTILLNSVDAAFTTDEVKAQLRAELGF